MVRVLAFHPRRASCLVHGAQRVAAQIANLFAFAVDSPLVITPRLVNIPQGVRTFMGFFPILARVGIYLGWASRVFIARVRLRLPIALFGASRRVRVGSQGGHVSMVIRNGLAGLVGGRVEMHRATGVFACCRFDAFACVSLPGRRFASAIKVLTRTHDVIYWCSRQSLRAGLLLDGFCRVDLRMLTDRGGALRVGLWGDCDCLIL